MHKLYITIETMKHRMGINPELEGVDESLESAIIASQLRIESYLDSKLDRSEYTDLFYLDKDAHSGNQPGGLFRCYLTTGLVDPDEDIVVNARSAWNGDDTLVPASYYKMDATKGVLYIDATYADQYLSVAYTAGFTKGTESPEWLQECILAYAPVVLNFSQVAKTTVAVESGYRTSGDHALAVANPYTRNVGFVTRPVF